MFSIWRTVKRSCTEQCPFQSNDPRPPGSVGLEAAPDFVGIQSTMSSSGTPILRRRCCGRGADRAGTARARRAPTPIFSVAAAFDEVQTTPPRSPQNALIEAAELT
jgi:hypothetical protein